MQMLVRIHHRYKARVGSLSFTLHSAVVKSHTEDLPEEDRQSPFATTLNASVDTEE